MYQLDLREPADKRTPCSVQGCERQASVRITHAPLGPIDWINYLCSVHDGPDFQIERSTAEPFKPIAIRVGCDP